MFWRLPSYSFRIRTTRRAEQQLTKPVGPTAEWTVLLLLYRLLICQESDQPKRRALSSEGFTSPAHCLTSAFCSGAGFLCTHNTIVCTSLTTQIKSSIHTTRTPLPLSQSHSKPPKHTLMSSPLPGQPHPLFADGVEAAREHLLTVDNGEAHGDVKFRIQNLAKKSDTTGASILNGLTLDIPKGVIMGVIGPSGSGKSTLLRALNRLWEPPSGTVFLDGHDVLDTDVLSLRRKVGMLFQLPVLFEGTVADNIRYGPQLKGRKLSDEEVHKLLNLVDLDSSFATKTGSEMSVGQSQRVALARTLANSPEVLLLDEPTSALDPISTEHIEGALVKLKQKQGMTIVMVSHSIKQIQRIADIVCLLVDGEIVEVLKPDQLSQANHPMALRFLQLSS